jgi:hypothetical protein
MNVTSDPRVGHRSTSTRTTERRRRARVQLRRAGILAAALLGVGALAAGCGSGSAGHPAVASLGTTATTTTPPAVPSGSIANPAANALAFVTCMRTHGEPSMPEPTVSRNGGHTSVNIEANQGVDPSSPQYVAAYDKCKHILPRDGVGAPSAGQAITAADHADYLRAAACMRTHGVPNFPDPSFRDGSVSFTTQSPIDTDATQYKNALAACQKLIPAGLPYSSTGGS